MPNHIHGILIIDKNDYSNCFSNIAINSINHSNPTNRRDNHKDNAFSIVRMVVPTTTHNKQDNLLSKTMNIFKTKSSKLIHLNNSKQFHWQRSFHDRIIRNKDELNKIRFYIKNNPVKWELGEDRNQI
jgi:REP element-mobilizing transposase RayT